MEPILLAIVAAAIAFMTTPLARRVALIAAIPLLTIAGVEGRLDVVPLWALLGGALTGFLVHNFAPASIFLGDSGSLLVGLVVRDRQADAPSFFATFAR
ncbi:MAG: hypothetical protein ABIR79_25235 [Candidatus Binatia bacterium]